MSSYPLFFAATAALFLALRLALALARRALRRIDRDPREIFDSLHWPLQLFLLAAAGALALRIFPGFAEVAKISRGTGMVVLVAAVWLGIRVLSLVVFRYVVEQIRGVPPPMALQRIARGVLYYACIVAYLNLRYHFRVVDLLITSAVIGILVSIPLQSTLANLIAGIQLSLGDHFRIGDRVRIGEVEGTVTESHWSSLQLESEAGYPVTVPVRRLMEVPIVNLGSPRAASRVELAVTAPAVLSPATVRQALLAACRSVRELLAEPEPRVWQRGVGGGGTSFDLELVVADARDVGRVRDRIASIAWYRLARAERSARRQPSRENERRRIADCLRAVDFLSPLSAEEVEALAELATLETYGEGEVLFEHGSEGDELVVVASGALAIEVEATSADGIRTTERAATVGAGAIVGEISLLTGEPRTAGVVVAEESELVLITREAFQRLLAANGQIARDLSRIMEERLESDASLRALQAGIRIGKGAGGSLLSKIRALFDL